MTGCTVAAMRVTLAGLATCCSLFGGRVASAQSMATTAQASASDDRLAALTLDTLASRFADLELQRPALLVRLTPEHSDVRAVDRRRQILCEALRELPHRPADAWQVVSARVLRPIEERLAGLRIERHILVAEHRPAHDVRALEAVIEALERRRSELLAPGGNGLCGTSQPGQR